MDPLYNKFSTYLQFLNSTTFEPTEEIDLRYLSLFLFSAGFWRCQNSSTSIYSLHKHGVFVLERILASTVKLVQSDT
jgi:hypothetical protein